MKQTRTWDLEVLVVEDAELPTAPTGSNALGPPLPTPAPAPGLFAVPLGRAGVAFISEQEGEKRRQAFQVAPGALLAAWAPLHPNCRTNLLAVATAEELQLLDVQADAASVAARPAAAFPVKQRLRQIGWRPEDPRRKHHHRLVLCASTAAEVTLYFLNDDMSTCIPRDKTKAPPTRVLAFSDPVDGWAWVEGGDAKGPRQQLVVMSGGRLHRFGGAVIGPGDPVEVKQQQQQRRQPSSLSSADAAGSSVLTTGPAVRGRCIGVAGAEQLLVVVTSGPCGLQQGLRQRVQEAPAAEMGVLNSTLLELRRTQRQPSTQQEGQPRQPAIDEQEEGVEAAAEGSTGGVIDLVGKLGPSTSPAAAAGADGPTAIPAGLLLHNLGGGLSSLRVTEAQPPQPQQPPSAQDTLSLARCPPPADDDGPGASSSSSSSSSALPTADDARFPLASVPLQPLPGPNPSTTTACAWSASLLACGGGCAVVASHLSPTLLAYRLRPQQQEKQQQQQQQQRQYPFSAFEPLPLLALPDGFRPRGLAVSNGRAFCLAARRHHQWENGGPAALTGWAQYKLCLFAFDLEGGGGVEETAAAAAAAVVVVDGDPVLAFLKEFRGEVVGRMAALEAAVAAQGERLARLEERWREGGREL